LFGDDLISKTNFSSVLSQGQVANLITDVMTNWKYLLAALGFAILVSFIFMFLLRCIAGCVVWCSLFGIILFFIGIGLLFLYSAGKIGGDHANTVVTTLGVPSVSASANNEIYGWVAIGIGCLFLIVVLCCCSRLRLAVAVCKSAGQFVSSVCSVVMVPIFQTIFQAGLWGACLVAMVYLVSGTEMYASTTDYFSSIKSYDN
jgi:Plasma-membrane choline transporter